MYWLIAGIVVVGVVIVLLVSRKEKMIHGWNYEELKHAVTGVHLPAMFVDLERFDENIDTVKAIARKCGKTIRLGTKVIGN